jgi:hypothetical protein
MSLSAFLLAVGQLPHQGVVDYEQVRELARINGDLGRLGGLPGYGSLTMSAPPIGE